MTNPTVSNHHVSPQTFSEDRAQKASLKTNEGYVPLVQADKETNLDLFLGQHLKVSEQAKNFMHQLNKKENSGLDEPEQTKTASPTDVFQWLQAQQEVIRFFFSWYTQHMDQQTYLLVESIACSTEAQRMERDEVEQSIRVGLESIARNADDSRALLLTLEEKVHQGFANVDARIEENNHLREALSGGLTQTNETLSAAKHKFKSDVLKLEQDFRAQCSRLDDVQYNLKNYKEKHEESQRIYRLHQNEAFAQIRLIQESSEQTRVSHDDNLNGNLTLLRADLCSLRQEVSVLSIEAQNLKNRDRDFSARLSEMRDNQHEENARLNLQIDRRELEIRALRKEIEKISMHIRP